MLNFSGSNRELSDCLCAFIPGGSDLTPPQIFGTYLVSFISFFPSFRPYIHPGLFLSPCPPSLLPACPPSQPFTLFPFFPSFFTLLILCFPCTSSYLPSFPTSSLFNLTILPCSLPTLQPSFPLYLWPSFLFPPFLHHPLCTSILF